MSATTTEKPAETTESAGNSEDTKPKFDISTLGEDLPLFNKTEKTIQSYNKNLAALKEMSGDVNEVADTLRNESKDPEIVSLRDAVTKAQETLAKRQAALDEIVKAAAEKAVAENTDTEKRDALKAVVEKELKRIKATKTMLVLDYGDEILSAFTPVANQKGTGSASGRGAGVARPRNFTVTVDGKVALMKNNSGDEVSSFSAAAKVLGGIPAVNVQTPYFESEGTDSDGWVAGKTVTYKVKDSEGKEHTVTATKNKDK